MTRTEQRPPSPREHLEMAMDNLSGFESHLGAAASLLRFSAGPWVGAENDVKRARAGSIEDLIDQLDQIRDALDECFPQLAA